MRKFLFLSWFYKTKKFKELLFEMLAKGKPCAELLRLWRLHQKEILSISEDLSTKKIKILTFLDESYPLEFRQLEDPPWILCVKGDLNLLKAASKIAIVGSRRPDPEVLYWLHQSMKEVSSKTVVVSGGATGIDQLVHKTAHINGLPGICISPVGIFETYPKTLESILKKFFEQGDFLLISQFHPYQKVSKPAFYPRNYVLSALSNKVVVVQAALKSGTMVTARYAMDLGKEVYALPASPWDERYGGNLKLIEEGAYQIMDLNLIHL